MTFTKKEITAVMAQTGMIPVFNHADINVAKSVLDASYRAGIRVFEFTNRGENSLSVFKELKAYAKKYKDMLLGIGTIFTPQQAEDFLAVEADFIVSPALIPSVAAHCNNRDVLWIPGCGTVTEIFNAKEMGAEVIKAFPGNVLGPSFVSAVKAVMPDLKIMPTGGVEPTEENLSQWFGAGVVCVGMGSQLFKKEWIKEGNYTALEQQIEKTLKLIQSINTTN